MKACSDLCAYWKTRLHGPPAQQVALEACESTPWGYDRALTWLLCTRYAGMEAHLILRTSRTVVDDDPGVVGNLLVDRMVGATVHLVRPGQFLCWVMP